MMERQIESPMPNPPGFVLQKRRHLVDDFIDVERRPLRVGLLQEPAHALDYVSRPVTILDDPFDGAPHIIKIRRFMAKKAQASLPVGDDGRERLIYLMRD